MPICRYYQRGYCRKGNNCNFDHVDGDSYSGGGGGSSVLKRESTHDSSSYDDGKYSKRYDQSRYDRNVSGHHVTVSNDYYVDHRDHRAYVPQRTVNNDRFHYDSRHKQDYQPPHNLTVNDIYSLLKQDILVVEQSKIWPLTCICIVKLFGSLDDWYDYSPEEMRLAAYIAKASNNFEGYKTTTDKIIEKAQLIRDFYKCQTKDCSAKLRKYINQNAATIYPLIDNQLDFSKINYESIDVSNTVSQFGGQIPLNDLEMQSTKAEASISLSVFPTQEVFSSQHSSKNVFGTQQDTSKNVFGSTPFSSQNVFGIEPEAPNVFGSFTQTGNKGFSFATVPQKTNVFGNSPLSENINTGFTQSQNTFGSVAQSVHFNQVQQKLVGSEEMPRDIKQLFPKLSQTDLDVEILSIAWNGHSPYSIKSDLTDEEYEQFKANKFSLDKLPMVPPPKELC